MRSRVAMVLGATGLVGTELVRGLAASERVARVVAIVRRPGDLPAGLMPGHRAKVEEVVVDYDQLDASAAAFTGVTEIHCALGTTIRQAGSQQRFTVVDHDYPVRAARLGLALGARHFLLVSAAGASAGSRIFYNRVKGTLERDLLELGYDKITIVRPSLLLGDRRERRLGEEVAKRLGWLMPARWAPVHARDVAAALIASAADGGTGVTIIESASIARMA